MLTEVLTAYSKVLGPSHEQLLPEYLKMDAVQGKRSVKCQECSKTQEGIMRGVLDLLLQTVSLCADGGFTQQRVLRWRLVGAVLSHQLEVFLMTVVNP